MSYTLLSPEPRCSSCEKSKKCCAYHTLVWALLNDEVDLVNQFSKRRALLEKALGLKKVWKKSHILQNILISFLAKGKPVSHKLVMNILNHPHIHIPLHILKRHVQLKRHLRSVLRKGYNATDVLLLSKKIRKSDMKYVGEALRAERIRGALLGQSFHCHMPRLPWSCKEVILQYIS